MSSEGGKAVSMDWLWHQAFYWGAFVVGVLMGYVMRGIGRGTSD